jgi:hypothetical protein
MRRAGQSWSCSLSTSADKKRPAYEVFAVDGEGNKARWTPIGAAWPHDDGEGFNVTVSAFPLNGRLVLRKPKERTSESE